MPIQAAKLITVLEVDDRAYNRRLQAAEQRTDQFAAQSGRAAGQTRQLADAMDRAGASAGGLGGNLALVGAAAAGGMLAAQVASRGLGAALSLVSDAGIGLNATLETSQLQFETLIGDADEARTHVAGLFDFAARTPFETGPIIEASRLLRTMGGAALDTSESLVRVGDAAAATGTKINEIAFWVGRAYSAIQSGRPFGEAALRLQELAVLSPRARNEIEALQESGASASEIWAVLTGDLDRFTGAMVRQASTWQGVTSTFSDGVNLLLADAFRPFFLEVESGLAGINERMAGEEGKRWAEELTAAVNDTNAAFGRIRRSARDVGVEIDPLAAAFGTLTGAIRLTGDVAEGLSAKLLRPLQLANALSNLGRGQALSEEDFLARQGQGPGSRDDWRLEGRRFVEEIATGIEDAGPALVRASFAGALDQARLDQLMGSAAVSAIRALDQMAAHEGAQLDQTKRAIATSAQAVAASMREKLGPDEGGRMAREWLGAITAAVDDGSDEAKARVRQIAEAFAIDADMKVSVDRAVAEARRLAGEAERAAREAEQRSRTALRGFSEGWAEALDLRQARERFGEDVGEIAALMQQALRTPTPEGMALGQRTASEIAGLVEILKREGVPEYERLGNDLADAASVAFVTGVEGGFSVALDRAAEALRGRRVLSLENLGVAFDRAQLGGQLGGGASIIDDLVKGLAGGGAQHQDAVARAVAGMFSGLEGVPREEGERLAAELAGGIRDFISSEGGPEARAALEAAIGSFNTESILAKAREASRVKLAEAQGDLDRLTAAAVSGSDEFKRRFNDALSDIRFREVFQQAHEEVSKLGDDAIADFRRKQTELLESLRRADAQAARSRQEGRQDTDVARQRTREDALAQRDLQRQLAEAQRRGAKPEELAEIQRRAGERAADLAERRRFEEEDRALARARASEDEALARASAGRQRTFERQQAIDLEQEKLRIRELLRPQLVALEERETRERLSRQLAAELSAGERRFAELNAAEAQRYAALQESVYAPAAASAWDSFRAVLFDPAAERAGTMFDPAIEDLSTMISLASQISGVLGANALLAPVVAGQAALQAHAGQAGARTAPESGDPGGIEFQGVPQIVVDLSGATIVGESGMRELARELERVGTTRDAGRGRTR
jgi:hypothetical protein